MKDQSANKGLLSIKKIINEYNEIIKGKGGKSELNLSIDEFIESVGANRPKLARFLGDIKGTSTSFIDFAKSAAGATLKTLAFKAAAIATDAALTMGISALVQLGIEGISHLINYYDELDQKVKDVTATYKEQKTSLTDTSKELETLKSNYTKFSPHIDSANQNIDLPVEEYQEYLDTCNKLGEMFPTLVQGYDSQGNAILKCKGNVEELTEAYNNLRKENNNSVINEANNFVKDFNHKKTSYENGVAIGDVFKQLGGLLGFGSYDVTPAEDSSKLLNELLKSPNIEEVLEEYDEKDNALNELSNAFTAKGFRQKYNESYKEHIQRIVTENHAMVEAMADNWNKYTEEAIQQMKTLAEAYADNAILNKGDAISEKIGGLINSVVSSFDYDFFKDKDSTELSQYINNMVDSFASLSDNKRRTLEFGLNAKTALNNNECTYSEYLQRIENAKTAISSLPADVQAQVELVLQDKDFDDKVKSLTNGKSNDIASFLKSKTKKQIDIFYNYVNNKDNGVTLEDLKDISDYKATFELAIKGNKESIKTLDELKTKLEEVGNFAASLGTAIGESASGTGLSASSISNLKSAFADLDKYDASTLFEKTAYGVHLNREELDKLTKSYEASQKADYQRTVNDLAQKYVEAAEKLDNLKDTDEGYQEQLATAEGLKEQLEQARLLQSQFDGLTSAYNKFVEATSASDERESYSNIGDSYEEMKKLVSNGWYGDKGLNAYLDLLLSDTERTGNAIKDFNKLTAKIKGTNFSIMDFFQYNKDGDLTSVGLYNFLDAVKQVMGKTASEYVKINKDGSSTFDFTGDKVSEVAEKLRMSEEAVHRLTQAMIDAGWDVKMDDASDSAETLSQKLEKAQSAVEKTSGGKEIVDSYKVDVDTKNYDEEITKANSYIKEINNGDLDTKSQKAALDYVNAELDLLIQKKLALSQPTFMNLNVSDVAVGAQDILKSLQDYQRAVNEVNSLKLKGVNTDSDEYKKAEEKVKSLAEQVLKLSKESGIDIGVDVNSDNYKTFAEKVEKDEIVIPLAGDASEVEDSLAKSIKNALDGVELSFDFLGKEHTINIKANVEGQEQVDNFNASKDKAGRNSSATVSATVQGKEAIDSFNASKDKADEDASTTLTADTSDASSKFASILEKIRAIANNWFIKMSYSTNKGEKGVAGANGTAITGSFANGTAFLKGNWGTKDSGTALGGELGQELVVRGSRFFTIGDESAEFFKYQKGDIIFNADQTREILAKGKIRNASRRGKAYLEGTAFAYTGSSSYGKPNIPGGTKSSASKSSSSSKRKSSSSSSNSKDTKETFDWVETAITRIEEAIDRLDVKASSTYRSWSERNSNLKSQISQTRKEIDLQQQAYNRYIQEANKVGLNSKYRSMIQNGSMNISTIKDEKLIEKIKEYQDWYEKAIKCKDAIDELKESVSKLYETAFENVSKEYEGYLAVIEHEKNILEEYISQSEAKGRITSVKYYEALIDTEQDNIAQLQKERNALVSAMNNAVNSGAITKGSEAWYEMVKSIDDVTMSIEEANTALLEYQNNIRETKWESFDLLQDNISQITSEADFLIDLLSNDKLVDDTGKLSNSGMASVGLHGVNYNTYMAQADKYAKEMKKINTELAKDPANKDLLERRNELLESQRDAISSAEDEKQAIKDLVEDGIEKELDSLQELIDKYNEALDSQKDLYDYQKNVKEQTKEIASLQKQLDAYANDTSEETKAKIQQLTVSLEDARAELEETEYDKYISDQKDILDNLYTEYEDLLNSRLDNLDYLIEDMIANINDNATSVRDTILEKSDDVGYTLTDSMSSIWDSNIETITSVVTTYNDHFSESLTSVNAVLNSIDSNLNSIINKNNAEAANKAKNASTSSASSNKPSSNTKPVSNNKTTNNSKSSGNFFKYKKDSYPKSKLDKEKSIVDRLKYFNFDSSFSARKSYYSSMGLGSNYTGSASQNTSMIRWMKTHGYSQGGFIGELQRIGKINGDDSVTVNTFKKGEAILTPAQAQSFESFVKQLTKAENIVDISEHLNRLGKLGGTNTSVDVGGININIPIERVEDYNDFISQLKTDRNFERLIQSMSVDLLAGKSSLRKYR